MQLPKLLDMDFIEKEILKLKEKNISDLSQQLLIRLVSEVEGLVKGLDKEFYTISEVAGKYKTNDATVRKWIREGKLKVFKYEKIIRIKPSSLVEFEMMFTQRL